MKYKALKRIKSLFEREIKEGEIFSPNNPPEKCSQFNNHKCTYALNPSSNCKGSYNTYCILSLLNHNFIKPINTFKKYKRTD